MKLKYLLFAIVLSFFNMNVIKANPFSSQSPSVEVSKEQVSPSFFTKTWFKFMQVQKKLNMQMTSKMNAIKNKTNPMAFWILISIAFIYGMLHALGPGHGKLLVLFYLTSHEAQWWKGVLMGFQIAFMHVISAVGLVLLTDGVARHALGADPSIEIKLIKLISYGAIVLVGLAMLWQIYKDRKNKSLRKERQEEQKETRSQWLLALSIGLAPCTGALLFLFYAMSKQMLFTGISIVLSMAFGIAVTLSLIGFLCIITRKKLSHFKSEKKERKIVAILHYAGAGFIVLLGMILFISTL